MGGEERALSPSGTVGGLLPNSHHVDFHEWAMRGVARPVRVVGAASTGVAKAKGIDTEDTITLPGAPRATPVCGGAAAELWRPPPGGIRQ